MERLPWYAEGVRFECTGSGNCCVTRGEFGFVYLTREDRRRLAAHFELPVATFTRRYCAKRLGHFHINDHPGATECRFLDGKRCTVYAARPTQCRTWPFWPDVIDAKKWQRDVASFCPGVGKGRLWSRAEIEAMLAEQRRADQAE